jgi:hypothetical protein
MNTRRIIVVSLFILGLQTTVFGADNAADPSGEMGRLINAGDYAGALEIGQRNRDAFEGEPQFDFYYGLASLEAGNPSESVYAFERVVASTSSGLLRDRARLELARAYFITNNLPAAENLFNRVLATNPPENVRQNIEAFLQLIEARRTAQVPVLRWSIASQLGSDSNINSATSSGLIDTPLIGEIELDPAGQKTDDNYSNTLATVAYNYPFTRDRSLELSMNVNHLNNFSTDQFDIDTLQGEAAYNWGDESNRFRHGLTYSKVNLDQNGFQSAIAANSSWQHAGDDGWYQTVAGSYSRIRYDIADGSTLTKLRDVNQLLLSGGLTKIEGLYSHSLNLYHADENPVRSAGKHNGRAFTGFAYSLLYRLNAQHTPYLRASHQKVSHDSEHPVFFDTTRHDQSDSVTLGWFFQYRRDLMITAQTSFTRNDSNIPLFDYHRFKYQAGFRYQF